MFKFVLVWSFIIFHIGLIQAEIVSTPPPSSSDISQVFDGKAVVWKTGKGKPKSVSIEFSTAAKEKLESIRLFSNSPNRYWMISKVQVFGINNGRATLIAERPWYTRKESDKGSKDYELSIPVKKVYQRYEIRLFRPHCYVYMKLNAIVLMTPSTQKKIIVIPAQTKGDASLILEGKAISWDAGKGKPISVMIEFPVSSQKDLNSINLFSHSPNRYWIISKVKLFGIDNGKATLIAEQPWYTRKKEDKGSVNFELKMPVKGKYKRYRVCLIRPHSYVLIGLNGIKLKYASDKELCELIDESAPAKSLDSLLRGKRLQWPGWGVPQNIALKIIPQVGVRLQKISFISPLQTRWVQAKSFSLEGITKDGQKKLIKKLDIPKYKEKERSKSIKVVFSIPDKGFKEYRLILSRVAGKSIMIQALDLEFANYLHAKIKPSRRTVLLGEALYGVVEFNNTFKQVVKGEMCLKKLKKDGSSSLVLKKKVQLKPGITNIKWEIQTPAPADFSLVLEFSEGIPLATCPTDNIEVASKRSSYWMPVGVCNAGSAAAWYGFNVKHTWALLEDTNNINKVNNFFQKTGMTLSSCNIFFGNPDAEKMVNSEGKSGGRRYGLQEETSIKKYQIEILRNFNRNPSVSELAYHNEHALQTWQVKGLCDYSKKSLDYYHRWLKGQHGSIDKLNKLYKTSYKDFSKVEPPRKFEGPSAAWFDWMLFRRYNNAEYFRKSYKQVKALVPDKPISPKGIGFDYYYVSTALDPWIYNDAYDVYGYDQYAFVRDEYLGVIGGVDFMRTQTRGKKISLFETNVHFRRVDLSEKRAEDIHLLYLPAFLRELHGQYYFIWKCNGDGFRGYDLMRNNGVLSALGRGAAQLTKAVLTLAPVLTTGKIYQKTAAVYFPTEEALQTPNLAPINAWRGAYNMLTQLHYPTESISYHNVLNGELKNYKILVLPLSRHLYPKVAKKIVKFVKNGGILITEYQAGRFDQHHNEVKSLSSMLGIETLGVTDKYTSFNYIAPNIFNVEEPTPEIKKLMRYNRNSNIPLHKANTWHTPFSVSSVGKKLRAPIDRAEKIRIVDKDVTIVGTYNDKTTAITEKNYGKGKILYFANTFFNSYRPYFSTHTTAPSPATRGRAIEHVGDLNYRRIVRDFLGRAKLSPTTKIDVFSHDVALDDSPFVILSPFVNEGCMLLGITNWGPNERHNVKLKTKTPFKINKLFLMDTIKETLKELAFNYKNGTLSTVIPELRQSYVLICIGDRGPILAIAEQNAAGGMVKVKVMNFLPEDAKGKIELRVDGVETPLCKAQVLNMKSGKTKEFRFQPDANFNAKQLTDPSGARRPWYIWITYDGNAKAFARVHPMPQGFSAP